MRPTLIPLGRKGRFGRLPALALSLLLMGGASAAAQGDSVEGEAAYATTCARCHASVARIVRRIDGATEDEKRAWLDAFLPTHHASDEAVRADLIAYMLAE